MSEQATLIEPWDTLCFNAHIASMCESNTAFGMLDGDAIAVKNGSICWLGKYADISEEQLTSCPQKINCSGQLITPGLIDCHTHLVYGGNRANEFEMRLKGASYAEIAGAGGGIVSTVKATRDSSEEQLFEYAKGRLQPFLNEGVTTIEIKSGYGLTLSDELKMLKVARRLGKEFPVQVLTSFLGAHATPPEYSGDNDAYIDNVCQKMIPAIAASGLADCVDAFCENIAFSRDQIEAVFKTAQQHELAIKLHAEQLSNQNGAVMAAQMGALSVDHIEYLRPEDVAVLRENNTVAVLLPGAFYFLGETKLPPIEALRQHSVPIAIASDSNPGSSPVSSLILMLNMACTLFKLTPEESLAGVTRNAAKALGVDADVGTIEVGKLANLVLWELKNPAQLSYTIGGNPCKMVIYKGAIR